MGGKAEEAGAKAGIEILGRARGTRVAEGVRMYPNAAQVEVGLEVDRGAGRIELCVRALIAMLTSAFSPEE